MHGEALTAQDQGTLRRDTQLQDTPLPPPLPPPLSSYLEDQSQVMMHLSPSPSSPHSLSPTPFSAEAYAELEQETHSMEVEVQGGGADKWEVGGRNGGRGLLQAEESISAVFRIVCINIATAQIVQEQLVTALKVCRYRDIDIDIESLD